mgnify:CR=1 FL=1
MTDYSELKRLAEAVNQTYADLCEHGGDELAEAWDSAELAYDDAANPRVVLALIAENERLETERADLWRGKRDVEATRDTKSAVIAELKAENAGLKTGYEAYEQTVKELRAEVEALRKAMRGISGHVDGNIRETVRDCVNGHNDVQDIYGYCDEIDALIDAAMGKGEQS